MGLPLAARLNTPVARTSHYYFVLLTTMALANPFLAIWMTSKGLSPEQIGIINAMPFLVVTVFNQFIGRVADKAADWRTTIVTGSVVAAIGPFALFFVNDFTGILVVWTIIIVPFLAIGPVVDAASIRMARRVGADFGVIRLWGSIGFVVTTVTSGLVVEQYGLGMFVPMLAVMGVARALMSFRLPLFKAPTPDSATPVVSPRRRSPLIAMHVREIWRPWFILPLAGVALVHGSHMMQMGFGALIWQQAGVPAWVIGPLWAVGPAGEVFVMLAFARLARRFSARHLILFASFVTVVRWIGFSMDPPVWGLFVLQAMNMASFGLSYLGIVNFIANWTNEGIAAEAQSTFQAMRQGVQVAALTAFGFLMAQFGTGAFYGAALMGLAGAGLTIVSLFLMPVRHEQRQRSS